MGIGMIDSMLEPHMKDHALSTQGEVGITFMIWALVYTVASPLIGYVSFFFKLTLKKYQYLLYAKC